MPTDRLSAVTEQVAGLLDRAETEPDHPTEPERVLFAEALAAVRAGGADLLDTVTPHLWAYYRDLAEACGDDNLGMDPLADGDDIWEHVELHAAPEGLGRVRAPGRAVAVLRQLRGRGVLGARARAAGGVRPLRSGVPGRPVQRAADQHRTVRGRGLRVVTAGRRRRCRG